MKSILKEQLFSVTKNILNDPEINAKGKLSDLIVKKVNDSKARQERHSEQQAEKLTHLMKLGTHFSYFENGQHVKIVPEYLEVGGEFNYHVQVQLKGRPSTTNSSMSVACFTQDDKTCPVDCIFRWEQISSQAETFDTYLESNQYEFSPRDLGRWLQLRIAPNEAGFSGQCVIIYGPLQLSPEINQTLKTSLRENEFGIGCEGRIEESGETFDYLRVTSDSLYPKARGQWLSALTLSPGAYSCPVPGEEGGLWVEALEGGMQLSLASGPQRDLLVMYLQAQIKKLRERLGEQAYRVDVGFKEEAEKKRFGSKMSRAVEQGVHKVKEKLQRLKNSYAQKTDTENSDDIKPKMAVSEVEQASTIKERFTQSSLAPTNNDALVFNQSLHKSVKESLKPQQTVDSLFGEMAAPTYELPDEARSSVKHSKLDLGNVGTIPIESTLIDGVPTFPTIKIESELDEPIRAKTIQSGIAEQSTLGGIKSKAAQIAESALISSNGLLSSLITKSKTQKDKIFNHFKNEQLDVIPEKEQEVLPQASFHMFNEDDSMLNSMKTPASPRENSHLENIKKNNQETLEVVFNELASVRKDLMISQENNRSLEEQLKRMSEHNDSLNSRLSQQAEDLQKKESQLSKAQAEAREAQLAVREAKGYKDQMEALVGEKIEAYERIDKLKAHIEQLEEDFADEQSLRLRLADQINSSNKEKEKVVETLQNSESFRRNRSRELKKEIKDLRREVRQTKEELGTTRNSLLDITQQRATLNPDKNQDLKDIAQHINSLFGLSISPYSTAGGILSALDSIRTRQLPSFQTSDPSLTTELEIAKNLLSEAAQVPGQEELAEKAIKKGLLAQPPLSQSSSSLPDNRLKTLVKHKLLLEVAAMKKGKDISQLRGQ